VFKKIKNYDKIEMKKLKTMEEKIK